MPRRSRGSRHPGKTYRRLTLAALHFLKKHGLLDQRSRFDVVAIVWHDDE